MVRTSHSSSISSATPRPTAEKSRLYERNEGFETTAVTTWGLHELAKLCHLVPLARQ
jgi:hypothetical protein